MHNGEEVATYSRADHLEAPRGRGQAGQGHADRPGLQGLGRHRADELLDGEIFDTLLEARVLIERYRVRYNTVRPHSSLGYRPPAPEAIVPWMPALGGFAPPQHLWPGRSGH